MRSAKRAHRPIGLKVSLPIDHQQRDQIDDYFARNRDKKKGETIKKWVLDQIRRENEALVVEGARA